MPQHYKYTPPKAVPPPQAPDRGTRHQARTYAFDDSSDVNDFGSSGSFGAVRVGAPAPAADDDGVVDERGAAPAPAALLALLGAGTGALRGPAGSG